jgi:hypothetical protein
MSLNVEFGNLAFVARIQSRHCDVTDFVLLLALCQLSNLSTICFNDLLYDTLSSLLYRPIVSLSAP